MPGNQNEPYSFQSLQEEAIRRAREMQSRAHFSSSGPAPSAHTPPEPAPGPHPRAEQMPIHTPEPAPPPDPSPEENSPGEESGMLDFLLKDNERTLIWILLLILLEEKADTSLLLALMYLAS